MNAVLYVSVIAGGDLAVADCSLRKVLKILKKLKIEKVG